MKILIVGSEGFIGSNCVEYFMQAGHLVYGIDLFEQATRPYKYSKISRFSPELEELFTTDIFDAVINAAGSANVSYSMSHPIQDFEANCLDTIRILDTIRKHQPSCKYLHLSSAAVYGNPDKLPVKESDSLHPVSPYGWHKLLSEQLCKEYTTVYNLNIAIARPFSVYGPGLQKQFFWDVFKKIKQPLKSVELFGTGQESRDYIFITDLVQAVHLILEKGAMNAEVYNIASGNEITIAEVAKTYFNALEINPSYHFNMHVRDGDPLNWRADISKIKSLGFISSVSLNEGLNLLASWIKQQ